MENMHTDVGMLRSRITHSMCYLQVYLRDLVLDDHARKKLIELVEDRYDPETDELTIVTDR